MNLPIRQAASPGGDNNAGAVCNSAASAHPHYTVGEVGFGRSWQDEEPGLRALYEEAQAQIAIYEVERGILEKEMCRLRERVSDMTLQNNELREVMAEIVTWVEDDLRETVDAGYRAAVEKAQKLTEGLR
jgi:hypothetical protein